MTMNHESNEPKKEQHPVRDFDESLLEINLQKTVEERIASHDNALELVREFQRAGRAYYSALEKK